MSSKTPLTKKERLNIWVYILATLSVNSVYGSGKQCTTTGKELLAFQKWVRLVEEFRNKSGTFEDWDYIVANDFTKEELNFRSKKNPVLGAHDVWELGMTSRRDMTNGLADFGRVLKFRTQQALTTGGIVPNCGENDSA